MDDLDIERDDARAALIALEGRLAAGEPVGREERRAVNARYQAAEAAVHDRDDVAAAAEALTIEADGIASTTELGEPR